MPIFTFPWGRVPDWIVQLLAYPLVLLHGSFLGRAAFIAPFAETLQMTQPTWWSTGLAASLFAADALLTWRTRRFAQALYQYLKDIGEATEAGDGVETAIVRTVERRGGGPGRWFTLAIAGAHSQPMEESLLRMGRRSGIPALREATALCSRALLAGGDIGQTIRGLGERFAAIHAGKRAQETAVSGQIFFLRILGLLVFPFLFAMVATVMDYPVAPHGPRFFAFIAISMGALDWRIFGSYRRAVAKQPLYLAVVFWVLEAGVIAGQQAGDASP